jgi:hypothetical protein
MTTLQSCMIMVMDLPVRSTQEEMHHSISTLSIIQFSRTCHSQLPLSTYTRGSQAARPRELLALPLSIRALLPIATVMERAKIMRVSHPHMRVVTMAKMKIVMLALCQSIIQVTRWLDTSIKTINNNSNSKCYTRTSTNNSQ